MKASPIKYVKNAVLSGSLFHPNTSTDLISGVDTGFFVDHEEPLSALDHIKRVCDWPLGALPDGHEFLVVVPAKPRQSPVSSKE